MAKNDNHRMDLPIVGQKKYVNACPRGHAEVATGPMEAIVTGPDGVTPLVKIGVCRMCVIEWWKWFPVVTLPVADFERLNPTMYVAADGQVRKREGEGAGDGVA